MGVWRLGPRGRGSGFETLWLSLESRGPGPKIRPFSLRARRLVVGLFVWGAGLAAVLPFPLAAQDECPQVANPSAQAGWEALGENRLSEARQRFEEALALCPEHLTARTGIGYVELREGRDDRAHQWLVGVLRENPRSVDALIGLGILAWRAGDLEAVADFFRRVQALDPSNPTAEDYLARLPPGVGPPPERPPLVRPDTLELAARARGDRLEVRGPDGWRPFYVKGVNLGAALPGRFPSEFPDSATYAGWIESIAQMGANTIRLYTIHPPAFYAALREHNLRNPERALWLLHGVWAELPPGDDYTDASWESEFFAEARRVVDLVHGRADIAPRAGHASGFYTADVSPWVLGYILGREWEPYSVVAFDSIHPELRAWNGEFVTVRGGNAMDAWLGKAIEQVVRYESVTYNQQRPASYTNWPTLDPMVHPVESTVEEEVAIREARGEVVETVPREYDNDIIGLDATLLHPTSAFPAGVFATFHAYPYYPDFMVHSREYAGARSSLGESDYFGYLRDLKAHHPDMPVLIAEYGVPASIGVAHLQPQGWHHGGHTEGQMADIDRRLTLEIAESGMAGGVVFAWIDEWFKRNWLTLPFELPEERNRLWLNRMDAEQQYGMVAMESPPPVPGSTLEERLEGWRSVPALYEDAGVARLRAATDAAYLWLEMELPPGPPVGEVMVGFDLLDAARGDLRWPGAVGPELPVGVEFVLQVTEDEARLLVDPVQNPFRLSAVGGEGTDPAPARGVADPPPGFFRARAEQGFNLPYATRRNHDGVYDSLRVITNRRRFSRDSSEILAAGYDRGVLLKGEPPDGQWLWSSDGTALEVRVPWALLNFTDPSQRRVLQGSTENGGFDQGGTFATQPVVGVRMVLAERDTNGTWRQWPQEGDSSAVPLFTWPSWEAPTWEARVRPAYARMWEAFRELDGWNPSGAGSGPSPRAPDGTVEPSEAEAPDSASGGVTIQLEGLPDPAAANQAWNDGSTETARRLYARILQVDPADRRALHRVALLEAWDGAYTEALTYFDRLLAIDPGNSEARLDRARVLSWASQNDEAIAAYRSILEDLPENLAAQQGLARSLTWAGQLPRGEEAWRVALARSPADKVSRAGLAQNLRWQGRTAAALEVMEPVDSASLADADFREQYEWVEAELAPRAAVAVVREDDSNRNRMTTVRLSGGFNPLPRLALRGEGYTKELEVSGVAGWIGHSRGASLAASLQLEPGWTFSAGVGSVRTTGSREETFTAYQGALDSPGRYPAGFGLTVRRYPLDETALLVEWGVVVETAEMSGRWAPASGWQVTGSGGVGRFQGQEENRRVHGSLHVDRRLSGGLTLGLGARAFGFQKDLAEFYFDPSFYGLGELAARWLREPDPVGLLLEAAPAVQRVGSHGDFTGAFRLAGRLTFRLAPGKEVSLSGGYSSTGLQSFSTGTADYRYSSLTLGGSWVF